METGAKLLVSRRFARTVRRDVRAWIELERGCRNHQTIITCFDHTPFDVALTAFLGKRARMG
jgi:hypothetical protein